MGEPMENKNLEKEIIGLEKSYWQALKDRNLDTMLKLSADPCIVAGASGVGSFTREQMAQMMKDPSYTLDSFEFDDFNCQTLNDNTVVVAYKVKENLTVEGKPVSFEAADASTWQKVDGQWVCVLHTESIKGDAFGRDIVKH